MSSFINENLNSNEKLICQVKLNFINSFFPYILLFIIAIIFIGGSFIPEEFYQQIIHINDDSENLYSYLKLSFIIIGFIIFIYAFYKYLVLKSIIMLITNQKILKKEGILNVDTQEIRLNAIETIEINRTLIDRLLGSGNLKITGRGNAVIYFENIDSPAKIKQIINQAISEYN